MDDARKTFDRDDVTDSQEEQPMSASRKTFPTLPMSDHVAETILLDC
jgi:hypothetical protein